MKLSTFVYEVQVGGGLMTDTVVSRELYKTFISTTVEVMFLPGFFCPLVSNITDFVSKLNGF